MRRSSPRNLGHAAALAAVLSATALVAPPQQPGPGPGAATATPSASRTACSRKDQRLQRGDVAGQRRVAGSTNVR